MYKSFSFAPRVQNKAKTTFLHIEAFKLHIQNSNPVRLCRSTVAPQVAGAATGGSLVSTQIPAIIISPIQTDIVPIGRTWVPTKHW